MIDKQALDAHLNHWAKKKNLAGVSAFIAGPDGCEYAWNYGFRDAAGRAASSGRLALRAAALMRTSPFNLEAIDF